MSHNGGVMRRRFSLRNLFRELSDRGIRVGTVRGIVIRLHLTLVLVLVIWMVQALLSTPTPLESLLGVLMFGAFLFGSVLLHELGHAWGAHLVGGHASEIVLWPLGGLARTAGAEQSAYTEFVVVLMGPAVSLGLAVAATIAYWLYPEALAMGSEAGYWGATAIWQLMFINWALFLFNMLVPLFPMDCARLARSLLSMRFSPEKITYNLCLLGFFVAGAMAMWFIISSFGREAVGVEYRGVLLLLIALFGVTNCILEMKRLEFGETVYTDPFPQGPGYRELPGKLAATVGWPKRKARVIEVERAPREKPKPKRKLTRLEKLELELEQAVEDEDFVRAANIRDQLRNLLETQNK